MLETENGRYFIDILDTAGEEEYMRENYYRLGEGFFIVYSVTNRDSFGSVPKFIDQIKCIKNGENVPIILLGSKNDLLNKREVKMSEGFSLAEKYGIPFFETSSKTGYNVDYAFFHLLELVNKFKKEDSHSMEKESQNKRGDCCIIN